MHIVMLAVQILAICVTHSWCASTLQNDRMSNPVSKKTENSMLRTKRLIIMSDLKSMYLHSQFKIIKK